MLRARGRQAFRQFFVEWVGFRASPHPAATAIGAIFRHALLLIVVAK